SLRETVEQNSAVLHSSDRHDGMMLTFENQTAVDLVAQHHDIAIADRLSDPIDIDLLQHATSWVLRRIQNDQFRSIIDQSDEFVDIELEIQLLSQPNRFRLRSDVIDD